MHVLIYGLPSNSTGHSSHTTVCAEATLCTSLEGLTGSIAQHICLARCHCYCRSTLKLGMQACGTGIIMFVRVCVCVCVRACVCACLLRLAWLGRYSCKLQVNLKAASRSLWLRGQRTTTWRAITQASYLESLIETYMEHQHLSSSANMSEMCLLKPSMASQVHLRSYTSWQHCSDYDP